jgi:transposase
LAVTAAQHPCPVHGAAGCDRHAAKRARRAQQHERNRLSRPLPAERQTEGQICKLKLVKRQMYGRGNIDLLQARVIGLA